MVANNDTAILSRLVLTDEDKLSSKAAEALLSITFTPTDMDRMNELAALARDGQLTPEQGVEAESCNRIGHFLALVHSKARLAFKAADGLRRESMS
jgi:hypothetical protein